MGEFKALLGVESLPESFRFSWENRTTLLIKKMNIEKWLRSHGRTDKSKNGNDNTMKIWQQAAAWGLTTGKKLGFSDN